MHQPKGSQLEIGLSHGGDRHARVGNSLNVLAKSVDVRGLKTKKVCQRGDAMVGNNAPCNNLAESKVNEHQTHLGFHVCYVAC
jgi:hypothetical protein